MAYKVVGTRPVRPDGVEKVTGRAVYGADVQLPGLLHGRVLRSPHAHARIKSIDVSPALAMPGVFAVVTSAEMPALEGGDTVLDLGEGAISKRYAHERVLARGKALFNGHPIAAVAAVSPHLAEEACKAIRVEYEVLPSVLWVLDAMKEDAPLLHNDLRTKSLGERTEKVSNIASHSQHLRGDLAAGFAAAEIVIEREFRTEMVHQGYIEPQNGTAQVNTDGTITVWTSTQGAFAVRTQVSELLEIPIGRIKVIPCEIGGGFGGKIDVYLEPLAVLLSKKANRPVKMVMSRTEVFQATGPTSGSYIWVKAGCKKDGTLTALQAKLCYESGAWPGSPVGAGMAVIFAPYNTPNIQVDGYDVVVNKTRTSAYRAPGGTNAAFASETVIDELAEACGMDPIDFRLKNAARNGETSVNGVKFRSIGLVECLEAVKNGEHYRSKLEGKWRGRGVASGYWGNWGGASSVILNFNRDGTLSLLEGSTDIGGSRASMAMIVAEELGLAYDQVRPAVVDTDAVGYTDVTGGSRTTYGTGWACYLAAQEAIKLLRERAAKLWECQADAVEYRPGTGCVMKSDPERVLTVADICQQMNETGGPISAVGNINTRGWQPAFAVHVVDVEVDPETGKVTVFRYTASQDVGRAIHPSYVEGQIQGGVVQGIGWALLEEYVFDEKGILRNPNLLDYRVPTTLDVPMIETILVEVPNTFHPLGVKGVGEVNIVPPAGALANALYRATGVRFTELPMKAERVALTLASAAAD